MITIIILTATVTAAIYGMGYITAEYKHWLKNYKLNDEETKINAE